MALAFPHLPLHRRAHTWFHQESNRRWATCPLTQAGFLRVTGRELGADHQSIRKALAALERDCQSPHHEYWPVQVDLRDLSDSLRSCLIGSNQLADMQLLVLAHHHRGQLVTFDKGLKEFAASTRYASCLLLL